MAYVDQAKKQKIAAALKLVVPSSFKYSLRVRNHSTIVMTIRAAEFDLTGLNVNHYHLDNIEDECLREVFVKIVEALNIDNHDNSDLHTDYFDVGHYVSIQIGEWNKPFEFVNKMNCKVA